MTFECDCGREVVALHLCVEGDRDRDEVECPKCGRLWEVSVEIELIDGPMDDLNDDAIADAQDGSKL